MTWLSTVNSKMPGSGVSKTATVSKSSELPLRRRRVNCSSRSEEHTSELQSHVNLVCRLLLEKKKKTNKRPRLLAIAHHYAAMHVEVFFAWNSRRTDSRNSYMLPRPACVLAVLAHSFPLSIC